MDTEHLSMSLRGGKSPSEAASAAKHAEMTVVGVAPGATL
jgi:hypothetical protein